MTARMTKFWSVPIAIAILLALIATLMEIVYGMGNQHGKTSRLIEREIFYVDSLHIIALVFAIVGFCTLIFQLIRKENFK